MRAAEVWYVEQVPSDGEPDEQWYERPRHQTRHAPRDEARHRRANTLRGRVPKAHASDNSTKRASFAPCSDSVATYERSIPSLRRRVTSSATPSRKGRGA